MMVSVPCENGLLGDNEGAECEPASFAPDAISARCRCSHLGCMPWPALLLLVTGCLGVLAGYCRYITDEHGRVNLNNYRFTGGRSMVLTGFETGVLDLLARERKGESDSALLMLSGALLAALGVAAA